ncbi:hypothetical protein LY76DRAFT_58628 [Colletotrichum caudatum]|nr:hypothetical protein LY76DRAFT_58628 [Colletotrichum caudatum]
MLASLPKKHPCSFISTTYPFRFLHVLTSSSPLSRPPFFNNNFVQLSLSLLYVGRIACCHSLFTFGYSPSFHSFSNIAITNTPLGIPACIHLAAFFRPFVNPARYYYLRFCPLPKHQSPKYTRTSRNNYILPRISATALQREGSIPCVRPFCSAPVRSHEDLWLRWPVGKKGAPKQRVPSLPSSPASVLDCLGRRRTPAQQAPFAMLTGRHSRLPVNHNYAEHRSLPPN